MKNWLQTNNIAVQNVILPNNIKILIMKIIVKSLVNEIYRVFKRKRIKIHVAVTSETLQLSVFIGPGAKYNPYK
jgi:hypothetical protein